MRNWMWFVGCGLVLALVIAAGDMMLGTSALERGCRRHT